MLGAQHELYLYSAQPRQPELRAAKWVCFCYITQKNHKINPIWTYSKYRFTPADLWPVTLTSDLSVIKKQCALYIRAKLISVQAWWPGLICCGINTCEYTHYTCMCMCVQCHMHHKHMHECTMPHVPHAHTCTCMVWYSRVWRPTRHSIGHFGDDNPEQWWTSPIQ